MEILMGRGCEKTKPIKANFGMLQAHLDFININSDTFSWSWLPERIYCSLCEIGIL